MTSLPKHFTESLNIKDPNNSQEYLKALRRWIYILDFYLANDSMKQYKLNALHVLGPDVDHSALFQRILNNKKIYKNIPPRAYSYPWYDLLDKKEVTATVSIHHDNKLNVNYLLINQTRWEIESAWKDTMFKAKHGIWEIELNLIERIPSTQWADYKVTLLNPVDDYEN